MPMIEFLINKNDEVAIFLSPRYSKPIKCSITGRNLKLLYEDKNIENFTVSKSFARCLKKQRFLLVVECNIVSTLRETEINLVG